MAKPYFDLKSAYQLFSLLQSSPCRGVEGTSDDSLQPDVLAGLGQDVGKACVPSVAMLRKSSGWIPWPPFV
jgi:hypothetical protein